MTEEQRHEIELLAAISDECDQALKNAGYQNIPSDPAKRAHQAARYAVLRAEAYEARTRLERAIHSVGV